MLGLTKHLKERQLTDKDLQVVVALRQHGNSMEVISITQGRVVTQLWLQPQQLGVNESLRV